MGIKEVGLNPARLRSLLVYSRSTGYFRWLVKKSQKRPGDLAGCLSKQSGNWLIRIDRTLYQAHRLAWLYVHGEWPPEEIDHKDGVRSHNQWSNLRLASSTKNKMNMKLRSDNALGLKGVSDSPDHFYNRPYRARIQMNGRQFFLGRFATPEEAHAAYVTKAKELFGPYARFS